MAWWNVITRSIKSILEYPQLPQPLAQTLGSAVSDTLSILAKSHQTSHDRVQLRFSSITNYISCLHMSRAMPTLMPNQSLPKVISHKPTICDLTAVAPCFYFPWSLFTYFVWLSIRSDCRNSNLCKTTDIVIIIVEINCYTEHWQLPLVLAASFRYAKILFHQTHILCQYAVKVTSEILSNLVNSRGTYSSMYRLVMTSSAVRTAVCTRVRAD